MSTSFDIKHCPLCHELLRVSYVKVEQRQYYCPTEIRVGPLVGDGYLSLLESHYKVIMDIGGIRQSVILPPYLLLTKLSAKTTGIYRFPPQVGLEESNLIMTVPLLTLEDPEHLIKRIKAWVVFS